MDIIERLRGRVHDAKMDHEQMMDDAADEIERLRSASVDVLRCLDQFGKAVPLPEPMFNALTRLRAAVEQKEDGK